MMRDTQRQSFWSHVPERIRMWSPWWLRHVLAVERESHNRTMQELREAEAWIVAHDPKDYYGAWRLTEKEA